MNNPVGLDMDTLLISVAVCVIICRCWHGESEVNAVVIESGKSHARDTKSGVLGLVEEVQFASMIGLCIRFTFVKE